MSQGNARRLKRIAVLVSLESGHGRGVLMGIHRYARPVKPWVFRARSPAPDALKVALGWEPHGIIAHTFTPEIAEGLAHLRLPAVSVSDSLPGLRIPRVGTDNDVIGRMAAEHLLERGFRHFAFFGDPDAVYSQKREIGYRERLRAAGHACLTHYERVHDGLYDNWRRTSQRLGDWLKSLPKPIGIFACHDNFCLLLSETCLETAIAVPEEVALLGVDNDELTCDRAYPPLSSIKIAGERIGFEAAQLLDQLMSGRKAPAEPTRIPPMGVQVRRSTDILAISDPAVAAAMRFISEHAAERIQIHDVLGVVPMCRRALEKRFRSALGRTLLEEIYRVRIGQAKELLASTTMAVPEIAAAVGFRDGYHFWSTFRKKLGQSPADYRKEHQVA